MGMNRKALFLLLLLGAGCHDPAEPPFPDSDVAVDVTVSPEERRGGQPLTVTLVNHEAIGFGYNLCSSALWVLNGSQWEPAPPSLRMCTQELRTLAAGATVTGTYDVDIGLRPGSYKLVIRLHLGGREPADAASNSFRITASE